MSVPMPLRSAVRTLAPLLLVVAFSSAALAGVPDWFRNATHQAVPAYAPETNAVLLLDEGKITVKDSGEIRSSGREVYKILRPQGRGVGKTTICYDDQTKVTYLKGWEIGRASCRERV